jgi:hypothetical protein
VAAAVLRDGWDPEGKTFVQAFGGTAGRQHGLAHALALAGEVDRERSVFERAAAYANDVGLLAEEVDRAPASCSATCRRHSAKLDRSTRRGRSRRPSGGLDGRGWIQNVIIDGSCWVGRRAHHFDQRCR